jgi:hypothetical protein
MWVRASVAAVAVSWAGVLAGAGPAVAGGSVDPSTLVPQPPPGATCFATGAGVTCHTTFDASEQNEPAFELPCGQVYESAQDVRRGTRWYVDGLLDRRFVFQDASGSWSLSPTGDGPTVTWTAHANWQNVHLDATSDEETWPTVNHGMSLRITDGQGRPLFQYAGLDSTDGQHYGLGDYAELDGADAQAAICAGLTGG